MKTKRIIYSVALMAVCAAATGLRWQNYNWFGRCWWQDFLIALWPMLMGTLALSLTSVMVKLRQWWICSLYVLYFAIAGLGILCLKWHEVPWLRYEITETVYLILCADIALWCVSTEKLSDWETAGLVRYITPGRPNKFLLTKRIEIYFFGVNLKRARLINTIAANLLAAYWLMQHDRVWDILFGRTGLGAWLEYRGEMLSLNIDWAGLALAAAAFAFMLLLLRNLSDEHLLVHIFKGMVLCLMARTAIGFACDVFSVSSSPLRVLLTGSAWDIISIAALLLLVPASVIMKEVETREYDKWLRQGPFSALAGIKPSAAAPSQGGSQACGTRLHGPAARQDTRQDP